MIGVFLGWGLGAAGMRAAIASRNEVLLKSSLLRAEQTYVNRPLRPLLILPSHEQRCWLCKPGPGV
jgi:hypothetical protein